MKNYHLCLLLATAMLAACSGLSKEAREMTGDYYIPAISADKPLMELNDNGSCVMRAMRPGIISYDVPGRWNVKNDSLIMELRPDRMTFEGDSTLIGFIPTHYARKIADFNGTSLTLTVDGIDYVYYRRGHLDD